MRLEGKVALITGGGSGIGRASALRFAAEGGSIVASDLSEASAVETVAAIREAGGEATAVAGDVVSGDDAKAMVQAAVDAYGKLDVLVNSAGVSGRVEGVSHEEVSVLIVKPDRPDKMDSRSRAVSPMECLDALQR